MSSEGHFKIWSIESLKPNYYVVKVESLDSIPLTPDPYPATRFGVMIAYKDAKTLSFVSHDRSITKEEMLNYKTDTIPYDSLVGFPWYSLSYMKELALLKKISSKGDADKIMSAIHKQKYVDYLKDLVKRIRDPDIYGSIYTGMLLQRICIDMGYSPIGAGRILNLFFSKLPEEQKRKRVELLYQQILSQ